MIVVDASIVVAAQMGNGAALDVFVKALQRPIYNLARRMLASHSEAEDATQEILILAVTRLSQVREPGATAAWILKLAMRHLLRTRRQSAIEAMRFTTTSFAADVETGLAALPDTAIVDPERAILANEVKIGCTIALLICLSRPLRATYILGEIYELTDEQMARALEITPATARQRLRRARAVIENFTRSHCGIVSSLAACTCERRVERAIEIGRIGSSRDEAEARHGMPLSQVNAAISALEGGRRTTALMQSNQQFDTSIAEKVIAALNIDTKMS